MKNKILRWLCSEFSGYGNAGKKKYTMARKIIGMLMVDFSLSVIVLNV